MKTISRVIVAVFAASVLIAWQGVHTKAYADPSLSGKVVEAMNGGGYTYVLLEKDGEKTWAAFPETDNVVKGQTLTLRPGLEMTDFHSKGLNRTFKKIFLSEGPAS